MQRQCISVVYYYDYNISEIFRSHLKLSSLVGSLSRPIFIPQKSHASACVVNVRVICSCVVADGLACTGC